MKSTRIYEYIPYYIGKLLYAKGNEKEALSNLLPFAREHSEKFWVWTLLGDLHKDDKELQIACYCRGLLSKEPDKMKVRLHQKLAGLLVEREHFPEAKYEINKAYEIRKQNDWKISNQIKNWTNQKWFTNAEMPKNNFPFYKQHAPKANAILAKDLDSMIGVVTNVKKDKKVLGFIVNKEISGGFNYGNMMDTPRPGDKLEMWYVAREDKNGMPFRKVYHAEPTDRNPEKEIIQEMKGEVKIIKNKNIGFLDGAFIPPHMLNEHRLSNEQFIKARAVLNYNPTKKEWGWQVVNIKI